MRFLALFTLLMIVAALSFGCGSAPANNAGNGNSANTVTTAPTKTPDVTLNDAPTVTPAVKAYCDAWLKNDEAALRKVYSSDTLKSLEADMKDEHQTSLVKFLQDEKVSGTPCDAKNEEVTGDKAVAVVRTDKYPAGLKVQFVKEGGEWKWTNIFPDFDKIKSSTANVSSGANSNTSK